MDLIRPLSGNNIPGLLGAENASTIILPIPGKKVKSIEGFHAERAYINQVIAPDNIITTVLNEVYILDIISSINDGAFASNNRLDYALNFPPTINDTVTIFPQGGPVTTHAKGTNEVLGILCSEINIFANLGVVDTMTFQIIGYKLIIEDI